jgi:hypothetical protein
MWFSKGKSIDENWLQKKWRPYMAMLYMAICGADFILFPILWSLIQAFEHGVVTAQWQPLTLQGGGLIHLAFGAILGISAYGRTQEKLAGVSDNVPTGTTYVANPVPAPQPAVVPDPVPVSVPVAVNDKGQKVIPVTPQPDQ